METLTKPEQSKRKDIGSGYSSLAENLIKFNELGELPGSLKLERLDDGHGIEAAMVAHGAQYHHTCKLQYNNTKLQRAEKRALKKESQSDEEQSLCKRTRAHSRSSTEKVPETCFFCGQPAGSNSLRKAATFEIDRRVRACANLLGDTELLGRLSGGDMIALDAQYHLQCLIGLYNRARSVQSTRPQDSDQERAMSAVVFAELVLYIEETRQDEETAPVFRLADLVHLYQSRMEQLGVQLDTRIHSTRLKQRLLSQFPDMRAHTKGKDILMAFEEDLGAALDKACELDSDSDAVHLARAAHIVRRHIFGEAKPFTGFPEGCQEESVPPLLLALVSMILEGPSIKDQTEDNNPAAITAAQILKFNSVKHKRTRGTTSSTCVRHSVAQETPLPTYIGMMLHAHTRKKELVDRLSHLGLSISYDRVLQLSAQMGNRVCKQFHREQVVCPPKLRGEVFTTAAVDNIDHNPSATTSKDSFHGTGISLIQHPSYTGEGVNRSIVVAGESGDARSKTVAPLPHYYTDVPPVTSSIKGSPVPAARVESLARGNFQQQTDEEYQWLGNVKQVLEDNTGTVDNENTSWAAFHASRQPPNAGFICPTSLLPLFMESAHTVAMIRHSMEIVKNAVEHLNPGQTPVITFDQPLFALAKQIQWKWPDSYGEDHIVVMFGGLHIEMAALKTLGDWLKGSGWVQALVQAEIATAGTADSFLRASHVLRTRRAHQVTAAALYILQHHAYNRFCLGETRDAEDLPTFEDWCRQRRDNIPQFRYWATVLELELLVQVYVRSLRQGSFVMYLDALTELVPWFHALDHTHYARWMPVHLKDMAELTTKHPNVARKFSEGHFTVKKTQRVFSSIPPDQAHEQNNACIKGDGGAVGLTDNPSALRRWMVAGPEVARVIEEFQDGNQYCRRQITDTRHHDQTPSVQASFVRDVCSLVGVIEEMGNPFEEESQDLVILDSKDIAGPAAVETVMNAKRIGQEQFKAFTRECLLDRTKAVDNPIPRNKLKVFSTSTPRSQSKGQQQLTSVKNDRELFARLYIGCQTRDGNLEEFFCHENQACPPALSDGGNLFTGTKSDLITCLEEISDAKTETPVTTCIVLDGAAIVQMLKPAASKTFEEYAHQIFIPYISTKLQTVSRLDLIWDTYLADSLKGSTRAKRGQGVRRRVVAGASIPGNWQHFLRVDSNKTELFKFLSTALLEWFDQEDKQLVITDGEAVLSKPLLPDLTSLDPCNHEEADSRMLLHASHAAKHGHHSIVIRTVDTDVVVLAVSVVQELQPEDKLWLAFGTGRSFRYLAAHEIAAGLGQEKARALPMFHALTGCDTVSSFARHGKKTAWAVWTVMPELTEALMQLSSAPSDIPSNAMCIIERFVILLYDRTSKCTDIDKARRKLFARKNNVQLIPPTKAALEEHVKRAVYQGGHVWGQILLPAPELPPPTNWGWSMTGGQYTPYWTRLPEAAHTCIELVSCKCQKGCVRRCKCKKAALKCTALCVCEGDCT